MSAKIERNHLILRVDSQYYSTLPQNLEILKIHSRESPHPRNNIPKIFWLLATCSGAGLGANIRECTNKNVTNILLLVQFMLFFAKMT